MKKRHAFTVECDLRAANELHLYSIVRAVDELLWFLIASLLCQFSIDLLLIQEVLNV